MAIILDECGEIRTEFLNHTNCATCGAGFREDESDWASLCQDCGEREDEEERELLLAKGKRQHRVF
jgi:hypothetical protein